MHLHLHTPISLWDFLFSFFESKRRKSGGWLLVDLGAGCLVVDVVLLLAIHLIFWFRLLELELESERILWRLRRYITHDRLFPFLLVLFRLQLLLLFPSSSSSFPSSSFSSFFLSSSTSVLIGSQGVWGCLRRAGCPLATTPRQFRYARWHVFNKRRSPDWRRSPFDNNNNTVTKQRSLSPTRREIITKQWTRRHGHLGRFP